MSSTRDLVSAAISAAVNSSVSLPCSSIEASTVARRSSSSRRYWSRSSRVRSWPSSRLPVASLRYRAMNGTVAPSSSSRTAAATRPSSTASSSARRAFTDFTVELRGTRKLYRSPVTARKFRPRMSRTRLWLRPRGKRPTRVANLKGESHGEVLAPHALPRRAGGRQRRADGPVDAHRDRGARPVHERIRGPAGKQRRVRRQPGAGARRRLGPLRRRGQAPGDRRPVRGDQGPDRGLDDHRRRLVPARRRVGRRVVGGARRGRQAHPRVARGAAVPDRPANRHRVMAADAADARGGLTEAQLRDLIPGVLAVLVHRGADFATAEDAVQEALIRAVETWPTRHPDDPKGWLITTAWRRVVDLARSDMARRSREDSVSAEPPPGPTTSEDETLPP